VTENPPLASPRLAGVAARGRPRSCRIFGQQFFNGLVNLDAPFGKAFANFIRDALDLKITPRLVANLITEPAQFAGKLMVIEVLGEFSRLQQFKILQSLPSVHPTDSPA
jgi:hypothetical protein